MKEFVHKYLALIVLTIIGFILRIKIGLPELASDEVATVATASQSFPFGIVDALVTKNFHAPLFYFILHFWMKLFGEDTFTLRLLPILMGTACIPVAYLCGKNLISRFAGILTAVLVTFNFFMISYSHFCKFYAFLQLLGFLSVYFLIKFDSEERKKYIFYLALVNAMIVHTYVLGFLFVMVQIFVYVMYRIFVKKSDNYSFIVRYLLMLGIFVLPVLPMILKVIDNTQSSTFPAFWWYEFDAEHILSLVYSWFSPAVPWLLHNGAKTEATLTYYDNSVFCLIVFNIVPLVVMTIGLINVMKKKDLSACLFYSALIFIVAELVGAVLGKSAFCARFTTVCFPSIILAVVSGLIGFRDKRIPAGLVFICVYASVVFMLTPVYSRFNTGVSEIFKMTEILNYLKLKSGDCIIIPFRGYYLQKYYDVSDINFISFDINYAFKTGDKKVIDAIFDSDDKQTYIEAKEPSKATENYIGKQCITKLGDENKVYFIVFRTYAGDNLQQYIDYDNKDVYKLLATRLNYDIETILKRNFKLNRNIEYQNFIIKEFVHF